MKVPTENLVGAQLDWAVAEANGEKPQAYTVSHGRRWSGIWLTACVLARCPSYSTDWAHGGPIVERGRIALCPIAIPSYSGEERGWSADESYLGPTPLIAAMRCYVHRKLGALVDIPEELI